MKQSFSSQVKKEISQYYPAARHCILAELSAFINHLGKLEENELIFYSENVLVAQKIYKLLLMAFQIKAKLEVDKNIHFRKYGFLITVADEEDLKRILLATGMQASKKINPLLTKLNCCKESYLRGAFSASGSMSNPQKNYHMEIVAHSAAYGQELLAEIQYFGLTPKIIERKSTFVIYLKEGEQIVDMLNIMKAHGKLLELENLRILKGMRNDVNRLVNCETANIKKTTRASVTQREDIYLIEAVDGIEALPENIAEIANMRLLYINDSLQELGERFSPPLSKSAVNHRLRRISKWADDIRARGVHGEAGHVNK